MTQKEKEQVIKWLCSTLTSESYCWKWTWSTPRCLSSNCDWTGPISRWSVSLSCFHLEIFLNLWSFYLLFLWILLRPQALQERSCDATMYLHYRCINDKNHLYFCNLTWWRVSSWSTPQLQNDIYIISSQPENFFCKMNHLESENFKSYFCRAERYASNQPRHR